MSSAPRKPLGDLEAAVLAALWDSRATLSVRDVLSRVKRKPARAYTTVLTVLDRLHDKGLVSREKQGKAFLYRPCVSKDIWLGEQAAQALVGAEDPPSSAVLMAFLDSAERAHPVLIDQLSALIET